MNRYVLLISLICVALAGCGGGSTSSDATCASFVYQEDAQAHYTKSLDRDNDGIACEDLPHRPSAANPSPAPTSPVVPAPTITQKLEFNDTLARHPQVQRLSDGMYSFSVTAFITPIGNSTGLATVDNNAVVSLGSTGFKYFQAIPGLYLSHFSQQSYNTQAVAYQANSTVTLSAVAGDYLLLGRRCSTDAADNCDLIYGTARVQLDGTFEFCPQTNYSQSCISKIQAKLSATPSSSGEFPFFPSNALFGGFAASSTNANGVSVFLEIGSSIYSLFGQLSNYSVPMSSGTYTLSGLDNSGYFRRSFAFPMLSPNSSIPNLSSDPAGQLYIRSSSGILITAGPRTSTRSATLGFSLILP